MMDNHIAVLGLFLRELGVDPDKDTNQHTYLVQMTVYLGQKLSGVDLGYRFGWPMNSPYCRGLARDYEQLHMAWVVGEDLEDRMLHLPTAQALHNLRPCLIKPTIFPLEQERWLGLLAHLLYWREEGEDDDKILARLMRNQPRTAEFFDKAKEWLYYRVDQARELQLREAADRLVIEMKGYGKEESDLSVLGSNPRKPLGLALDLLLGEFTEGYLGGRKPSKDEAEAILRRAHKWFGDALEKNRLVFDELWDERLTPQPD